MTIEHVRYFVRDNGGQLRLVIQQGNQARIDVNGSVGQGKGIGHGISQSAELPNHVLEIPIARQQRFANSLQVGVARFVKKNEALSLEPLVQQVYLFEQIEIGLAEFEFFFGRRSRRLHR